MRMISVCSNLEFEYAHDSLPTSARIAEFL